MNGPIDNLYDARDLLNEVIGPNRWPAETLDVEQFVDAVRKNLDCWVVLVERAAHVLAVEAPSAARDTERAHLTMSENALLEVAAAIRAIDSLIWAADEPLQRMVADRHIRQLGEDPPAWDQLVAEHAATQSTTAPDVTPATLRALASQAEALAAATDQTRDQLPAHITIGGHIAAAGAAARSAAEDLTDAATILARDRGANADPG
ncbi:hypothetical protein [Jiangella sp. DSM 45060]|uniref:hypothetical protein n=1 Tax=Jiangella sp. DSM 45060 TaxID=1798224 RepID=UPI00087D3905|nr:hypothetical protein [Jiangella sp. DSM 45060]SDT37174.1 hypothetical protein SAMN04515669_3759 [Jiangella sp. DSM 45060]